MFGGKAVAVKVFVILILIATVIWILYSLNFSLPKINIKLADDVKTKKKTESRQQRAENSESNGKTQTIDQGFIRTLLKDKLKKEIHQKIDTTERKNAESKESFKPVKEKVVSKPSITFSSEKPTYNVHLLETNTNEIMTIDESFLVEKAKALQDKLLEFNEPIKIE
ncbi:hypothetical protein KKG31_05285 [Patescibacteria group bacterium]|nr:hypothetical protein [Patescibacteria group bacterium]